MARKSAANPARTRFAASLAKYLANGTRPPTVEGEPWTFVEFSGEISAARDNKSVSERSVSNWCRGKSLPTEIEPILRVLFGPSASNRHAEARGQLRVEYLKARAELIQRTKPEPAGTRWVARDDQFIMDRMARPTDRRAAQNPLQQQLQVAIRWFTTDLLDPANRLANSRTWSHLSQTVAAFHSVVSDDPLRMPERLGDAYALLLRLGRFLETDNRVRLDPAALDDPLDPDIHGLLTDLVRTAAPWLRGFPSVAAWDDEAGKALVRADLFRTARDFTRIARDQQAISAQDAAEVESLAEAADGANFQGQKAGIRAVSDTKNLILATAGTVAAFLSGAVASDSAAGSLLVRRAGATLTAAEEQMERFADTWPDDLRQALSAILAEARQLIGSAQLVIPDASDQPVPKVEEEQVSPSFERPKFDVPPFRIDFTPSERALNFPELMHDFYARNGRWPYKWELPPLHD